jgi:hypothetical protein
MLCISLLNVFFVTRSRTLDVVYGRMLNAVRLVLSLLNVFLGRVCRYAEMLNAVCLGIHGFLMFSRSRIAVC